MTTLGPITIDRLLTKLPSDVITILKEHECYLAGGFIRACVADETPSDIDLFVNSNETAEKIVKAVCCTGLEQVHRTPNAITIRGLGRPVQIITRWTYDSPASLLHDLDYTLAQACLWWDGGWQSAATDTFEDDVINRRLVYTQPQREEERAGSLIRLFKFFKRGYSPDLDTVAKVCARAFAPGDSPIDAGSPDAYSPTFLRVLEAAARRMPKAPVPGDYSEDDSDLGTSSPGFSAGS